MKLNQIPSFIKISIFHFLSNQIQQNSISFWHVLPQCKHGQSVSIICIAFNSILNMHWARTAKSRKYILQNIVFQRTFKQMLNNILSTEIKCIVLEPYYGPDRRKLHKQQKSRFPLFGPSYNFPLVMHSIFMFTLKNRRLQTTKIPSAKHTCLKFGTTDTN